MTRQSLQPDSANQGRSGSALNANSKIWLTQIRDLTEDSCCRTAVMQSADWIGQSGATIQNAPFLELADSMFDQLRSDPTTVDSEFLAGNFKYRILML